MTKASLTAENKRLRRLNSQLKQQQIEAIAVLQSLIPTQNQKWDKQYKDRLYYDLQEAMKILLKIE